MHKLVYACVNSMIVILKLGIDHGLCFSARKFG